jgi:hypothetical protein
VCPVYIVPALSSINKQRSALRSIGTPASAYIEQLPSTLRASEAESSKRVLAR